MVYVLDPDQRVYVVHEKSKVNAICEAARRYVPLTPLIRASAVRYVWSHMTQEGYCLMEEGESKKAASL